jgi:hypothetical protein
MKLCPYFLYFLSYLNKIHTGDTHNNLLSDYEFHENWHGKSYNLFKGHKFLPVLSTLGLGEIRYKRSAHDTVEHFRVL